MKVRVVEDNADLVMYLTYALEREDIEVVVTDRDFKRLIEADTAPGLWDGIDVALLDYSMPGITGAAIAAWLQVNRPHIRRVMWTAIAAALDDPDLPMMLDVLLGKPVNMDELIEAITG